MYLEKKSFSEKSKLQNNQSMKLYKILKHAKQYYLYMFTYVCAYVNVRGNIYPVYEKMYIQQKY